MKDREEIWAIDYDEHQNLLLMTAREELETANKDLATAMDYLGQMEKLAEETERNANLLTDTLQQQLAQARQDIIDGDAELDIYHYQLNVCQNERDTLLTHNRNLWFEGSVEKARYKTEQIISKSLRRQKIALKIANRQLQIRLVNPPPIIPPPPLANQTIWLLLQ